MILTITANPAIDLTWRLPAFQLGQTYTVRPLRRQPAGKGINVSLVLSSLGVPSTAIALVGASDIAEYQGALAGTKVNGLFVPVAAPTRRNLSLLVDELPGETHLREPGSPVSAGEARAFAEAVAAAAASADIVAMSGSTPPGLPTDLAAGILRQCGDCRTLTVLDAEGPLLGAGADAADLIKPNLSELAALIGRDDAWAANLLAADRDTLVRDLAAATAQVPGRGVCVTCGPRGAFLRLGDRAWYGTLTPPGPILNTCGAGDAFLAGYLWGLGAGDDPADRLRKALACGTVSCLGEGTACVDPSLVDRLAPAVEVVSVT